MDSQYIRRLTFLWGSLMQVEQVFAECTANGLLFKHFQQRQLEGAEVELFVNSPDFKTARDDKTYTLSAVPIDIKKIIAIITLVCKGWLNL